MTERKRGVTRPIAGTIGWWLVFVPTALMLVNHSVGVFAFSEGTTDQLMFAVYALLNAYTLVVVLIPFRRREPWAWWLTWAAVASFVACFLLSLTSDPSIGWWYLTIGAVMAIGLALTRSRSRSGSPARCSERERRPRRGLSHRHDDGDREQQSGRSGGREPDERGAAHGGALDQEVAGGVGEATGQDEEESQHERSLFSRRGRAERVRFLQASIPLAAVRDTCPVRGAVRSQTRPRPPERAAPAEP